MGRTVTRPARGRAASASRASATILAGALWGERGTLADDLRDAFQATGTVHVLVTAGLHLGAIAALIVALLRPLGLQRTIACAIAIVLVAAYAWLSGAHLPAQRAAVMIGIALAARACGARIVSWNALALAALAVAAIWPAAVESASFALSFSCVGAIVALAEPIGSALERLPIPEPAREAIALTVGAQRTWPLGGDLQHARAVCVVANAIVVPLTGIALCGGIATLVPPAAAPFETPQRDRDNGWDDRRAAGLRATAAPPPGQLRSAISAFWWRGRPARASARCRARARRRKHHRARRGACAAAASGSKSSFWTSGKLTLR